MTKPTLVSRQCGGELQPEQLRALVRDILAFVVAGGPSPHGNAVTGAVESASGARLSWRSLLAAAKADWESTSSSVSDVADLSDGLVDCARWIWLELALRPEVVAKSKRASLGALARTDLDALALGIAKSPFASATNWAGEFTSAKVRYRALMEAHVTAEDAAPDQIGASMGLPWFVPRAAALELPIAKEAVTRHEIALFVRDAQPGMRHVDLAPHKRALRTLSKAFDLKDSRKVTRAHDLDGETDFRVRMARLACQNFGARKLAYPRWKRLRKAPVNEMALRVLWADLVAAAWFGQATEWLGSLAEPDLILLLDRGSGGDSPRLVEAVQAEVAGRVGRGTRISATDVQEIDRLGREHPELHQWCRELMLRAAATRGPDSPTHPFSRFRAALSDAQSDSEQVVVLREASRVLALGETLSVTARALFRDLSPTAGAIALASALVRLREEAQQRRAHSLIERSAQLESLARALESDWVMLADQVPWAPDAVGLGVRNAVSELNDEANRLRDAGRGSGRVSQAHRSLDNSMGVDDVKAGLEGLAFDPGRTERESEDLRAAVETRLLRADQRLVELIATGWKTWPPEAWSVIWQAGLKSAHAFDPVFLLTHDLVVATPWAGDAWIASFVHVAPEVVKPPDLGLALAAWTMDRLVSRIDDLWVTLNEKVVDSGDLVIKRLAQDLQQLLGPLSSWIDHLPESVPSGN